jgi:hypothetical protein
MTSQLIERAFSADQLYTMGLVSMAATWLESEVEAAIWIFSKTPFLRGKAITTHMSQPLRENVLLALANQRWHGRTPEPKLGALIREIAEARGKRNDLLHNMWALDRKGRARRLHIVKARGHFSTERRSMSVKAMRALADRLVYLRLQLFVFVAEHRPKSSHSRRRKRRRSTPRRRGHTNA